MQLVSQIALVKDTESLDLSELTTVAAAIQKQIARDLSLYWDVQGTITPFVRLEDVPAGYWPILVRDDIHEDAAGLHCDQNGQPLALVTSGPGWSITASHEALEMLVDPFGNRTVAGPSPKTDQGRVEFLVEVADPIGESTYTVNDIKVSDFYTPRYFDPVPASGIQYCYTGRISGPRQLLPDGYLTWHDSVSNQWWQQSRFTDGEPTIVSLGTLLKTACGMRATVDRLASKLRRENRRAKAPSRDDIGPASKKRPVRAQAAASSKAKAKAWRAMIQRILKKD
jgi:hypothetical protein